MTEVHDENSQCGILRARIDALEKMLTEREDRNKERFEAVRRATEVATGVLDKRLDGMNEFREALKDMVANFVTRSDLQRVASDIFHLSEHLLSKDVYDVQHGQLTRQSENNTSRLYEIEKFIASQNTVKTERQQGVSTIYYIIGTAGVLATFLYSIFQVILPHH